MNKQEIDQHFVNMLPQLRKTVSSTIYKKNKNITIDSAINECYLYVYDKHPKSISELESIIINWLTQNIGWENSTLSKLELSIKGNWDLKNKIYKKISSDTEHINLYVNQTISNVTDDNNEDDLEHKIQLEKWYNEKKSILYTYRQQLQDKEQQIIFDLFFDKGIQNGIQLGKHLNINQYYAYKAIREMKENIKQYIIQFNNK